MSDFGFERVATLNEAAKELIARSFQVNLLALDAMVQSKRGGAQLRGFDEVSSQMRSWSRDLHEKLETLSALSQDVVALTSVAIKEAHMLRLWEATAASCQEPRAHELCESRRTGRAEQELRRVRTWRKVQEALSDLDLLGMMAVVLSRSAMIEAASGDSALRAQLTHVSEEFYRNSEAVVSVLKNLLKAMNRS